ncbi:MAG: TIGR03435 family protein [Bryobacteraceae bacterium]|nr:TIGR03435 family protein [Bryobacteraceae bacterium]
MKLFCLFLVAAIAAAQELKISQGHSNEPILHLNPGEYDISGISLSMILATAWEVAPYRVTGPRELATTMNATFRSPGRSPGQLRQDFRKALEERLALKWRVEDREVDGYVLRLPDGGSHRMKPSSSAKPHMRGSPNGLDAEGVSPQFLAGSLERTLRKPVFDETGVTGAFDFELSWSNSSDKAIADAVRHQLGLELAPVRRPARWLVVESVQLPK